MNAGAFRLKKTSLLLYLGQDKDMPTISLAFREPLTTLQIAKLTLYSFVVVTGTFGNGWVIKLMYKNQSNYGSRFIIALAAVDMVSSLWIPFIWMHWILYEFRDDPLHSAILHWPYGETLCLVLWPWFPCLLFMSAWLLLFIALERTR